MANTVVGEKSAYPGELTTTLLVLSRRGTGRRPRRLRRQLPRCYIVSALKRRRRRRCRRRALLGPRRRHMNALMLTVRSATTLPLSLCARAAPSVTCALDIDENLFFLFFVARVSITNPVRRFSATLSSPPVSQSLSQSAAELCGLTAPLQTVPFG